MVLGDFHRADRANHVARHKDYDNLRRGMDTAFIFSRRQGAGERPRQLRGNACPPAESLRWR
jgi:hypothetical protein